MTAYEEMRERQGLVDVTTRTLCELLDRMASESAAAENPQKWDDEYAGHAVNDCIDRLFCAPEAGMPKPSENLRELYHEVYERAAPFLSEDVPLPGEEARVASALVAWATAEERAGDPRVHEETGRRLVEQANRLNPEARRTIAALVGDIPAHLLESVRFELRGKGHAAVIGIDAKMDVQAAIRAGSA